MKAKRIPDAAVLTGWRKSSYSGAENQNCVEVADGFSGVVPVRDSKVAHGPAVVFPEDGWSSFVAAVKSGEFTS
ncbi:DUF397 domain-containing protein [Streptomyces noursei]|uniref:DUF397 domain-containing protein n=1 Tax=Streptomyces noursei TaxID=1971 RepID=UPI001964B7D8|nr:DUF397 domain-containing protein [Streptomyces noursei]QRX92514.1 DUF397 domain-containing protein [Streptomyces noursei]